jgi:TonB family protein
LALHAGLAVAGSHVFGGAPITGAAPAPRIDVDVTWEAPHLPPPILAETANVNVAARVAMHSHPYSVPPGHDARPHDPSLVHAPWAAEAQATPAAAAPEAAAPVVGSTDEAMPKFVLSVASSPAPAGAIAFGKAKTTDWAAPGGSAADGDATLGESAVDVRARLLENVVPDYPAAARAAEIETELPFEIVVDERGAVIATRSLSRAGYGLDEAAQRAVERMRFSPAIRAGRAVRVRMRWPVIFRLR